MNQHLHLIILGVDDIAIFQAGGAVFAICQREKLADDAGTCNPFFAFNNAGNLKID